MFEKAIRDKCPKAPLDISAHDLAWPDEPMEHGYAVKGMDGLKEYMGNADQIVELTGDAGGALWISDRRTSGRRVRLQLVTSAGAGHPPGAIAVATDGKFEVLGPLGAADLEPYLVCRAGPYQAPLPLCEERLRQPGLVAGFVSGLGPGSLRAVLNPAAGGGASLPSLGPGVRVQPRQHPTPMGAMPQRRRGGAAAPKLRLSGGTGRSGAAAGQVEP